MAELMQRLDAGMVFTLNPDHLYHLQRNAAFFSAYRKADFITSDSKYVYWSLGWIGRRIQEKVSGSDIVPTFCHHHRDNPDVKVFLLGAAPGIAQKALRAHQRARGPRDRRRRARPVDELRQRRGRDRRRDRSASTTRARPS